VVQLVSGAVFIATAQTDVVWGRPLSPTEAEEVLTKKAKYIVNGAHVTDGIWDGSRTWRRKTYWSSTDDARDFVEFLNTFNPPPVKAIVIEI
jgi:hypothetical protein